MNTKRKERGNDNKSEYRVPSALCCSCPERQLLFIRAVLY